MRRLEGPFWAAWLAVTAMMPIVIVVHAWNHNVVGLVVSTVGFVCGVVTLWRNRERWLDGSS
jgi:uncharacterized membrane protein YhaH (DUF805 family)